MMTTITKQKKSTLLSPILAVSGIVEKNQVFPILSHILLEQTGNRLSFLSSDAEIQIKAWIELDDSEQPSLKTTFPARKCIDILRSFDDQTALSFSQQDTSLTIASDHAKFKLQTLNPNDFPTLFDIGEPIAHLTVSQKTLKQLITKVQFSMAYQDVRYYFNGVFLFIEGKNLCAVATDSHRLAICKSDAVLDYDVSSVEVILPRKTVGELLKHLSTDEEKTVDISFYTNHIVFSFDHLELRSKLIDGKYPDYNLVLPKGYEAQFEVDAALLKTVLQRAAILADDKLRGVRLTLDENQLTVTAVNSNQEQARETLEVVNTGTMLDIGLNVAYLLDVLNNIDAQKFVCQYRDGKSSVSISFTDDPQSQHIIMPMRI